jgi:hypothetical protein
MNGYLVSVLMGAASRGLRPRPDPLAGPAADRWYGAGEYAVDAAKRHLAPPAETSIPQAHGDVQGLSSGERQ